MYTAAMERKAGTSAAAFRSIAAVYKNWMAKWFPGWISFFTGMRSKCCHALRTSAHEKPIQRNFFFVSVFDSTFYVLRFGCLFQHGSSFCEVILDRCNERSHFLHINVAAIHCRYHHVEVFHHRIAAGFKFLSKNRTQ